MKWINVKEALPQEGIDVLVVVRGRNMKPKMFVAYRDRNNWLLTLDEYDCILEMTVPTHWAYLPALPLAIS